MTVKELIAILSKYNPDTDVYLDYQGLEQNFGVMSLKEYMEWKFDDRAEDEIADTGYDSNSPVISYGD